MRMLAELLVNILTMSRVKMLVESLVNMLTMSSHADYVISGNDGSSIQIGFIRPFRSPGIFLGLRVLGHFG